MEVHIEELGAITFENIKNGSGFIYKGDFYIKLKGKASYNSEGSVNTINPIDGKLLNIKEDELVFPRECVLISKERYNEFKEMELNEKDPFSNYY